MQRLAKEFGLSDVGLAKLCRRHNIPIPGRGYWARIQFGQRPQRISLPTLKGPRLDIVKIIPSCTKATTVDDSVNEEVFPTIEVKNDRPITHPVARRIERSMSRKPIDERGTLGARQGRDVPLKISAEALPRALRLLDAFFAALDREMYVFEWPSPYDKPLKIAVCDDKLQLSMTEAIRRSAHKPTQEELARQKADSWWRPPRWDYAPSGDLKLTVESCEYAGINRTWTDGKRQKLEACLGEALVTCQKLPAAVKKEREDRAEAERLRREEEKRRAEEASRKAEYDRKAEAVKELAHSWQESRLLREFAAALRTIATTAPDLSDDARSELQGMIDWTLHNAGYVDPLTDLKWTINQFKNPPWSLHY
jgi:hypothetical protein